MILRQSILLAIALLATVLPIAAAPSGMLAGADGARQTDTEALKQLRTELDEAPGRKESAEILGRIAALDSEVAKPFLLEYFKGFPASQASTDAGRDIIKGAAFDAVLPLLKSMERGKFLAEVLEADIKGWREAKRYHASNKYPSIMLRKLLKAFETDGEMGQTWKTLVRFAKDSSLPEEARVLISASVTRMEAGVSQERIVAKIREVINDLPVKTYAIIPRDIYNDKEKYSVYVRSDVYQKQRDRFDQWRSSGNLFKYETSENVLHSYGEAAIQELVAVIEHGDVSDEKRDCLAMLAGELLANISIGIHAETKPLNAELPDLANRLALYVDKMDDPGAFSHRHYAKKGLSFFFENTGLPKFKFQVAAAGTNGSAMVSANASPSQTVAAGHEKHPRSPFNIVWVTLVLGGIPAVLAGVWLVCRRMKKKGSEM